MKLSFLPKKKKNLENWSNLYPTQTELHILAMHAYLMYKPNGAHGPDRNAHSGTHMAFCGGRGWGRDLNVN